MVSYTVVLVFSLFFSIKVYASAKDTQLACSANIGVYPDKVIRLLKFSQNRILNNRIFTITNS